MKNYILLGLILVSTSIFADSCVVVGNMTNCTGGVRAYNFGSFVEVHTPNKPAVKIYNMDASKKSTNTKVVIIPVGK